MSGPKLTQSTEINTTTCSWVYSCFGPNTQLKYLLKWTQRINCDWINELKLYRSNIHLSAFKKGSFLCCVTLTCGRFIWNPSRAGSSRCVFFTLPHYPTLSPFLTDPLIASSRPPPSLSLLSVLHLQGYKNKESKASPFYLTFVLSCLFTSVFSVLHSDTRLFCQIIHIENTISLHNNVRDFTKLASCILAILGSVKTICDFNFFGLSFSWQFFFPWSSATSEFRLSSNQSR